jgi:hypothetical protein
MPPLPAEAERSCPPWHRGMAGQGRGGTWGLAAIGPGRDRGCSFPPAVSRANSAREASQLNGGVSRCGCSLRICSRGCACFSVAFAVRSSFGLVRMLSRPDVPAELTNSTLRSNPIPTPSDSPPPLAAFRTSETPEIEELEGFVFRGLGRSASGLDRHVLVLTIPSRVSSAVALMAAGSRPHSRFFRACHDLMATGKTDMTFGVAPLHKRMIALHVLRGGCRAGHPPLLTIRTENLDRPPKHAAESTFRRIRLVSEIHGLWPCLQGLAGPTPEMRRRSPLDATTDMWGPCRRRQAPFCCVSTCRRGCLRPMLASSVLRSAVAGRGFSPRPHQQTPQLPTCHYMYRLIQHANIGEGRWRARLELFSALGADAPVRAPDGALPAHDSLAVRMLAEVMVRRERVGSRNSVMGLRRRMAVSAASWSTACVSTPRRSISRRSLG